MTEYEDQDPVGPPYLTLQPIRLQAQSPLEVTSTPFAHLCVISAQPGYRVVCRARDDSLEVSDEVIAWRIETERNADGDFHTSVTPLTTDGEPGAAWVGLQQPNRQVMIHGVTYTSLAGASAMHKKRQSQVV